MCYSKCDGKITFLTLFLARPVFTSTSFDDSRRRFFDFERRRKNFWNHFEFGCWRKRICQCLGVARLDVVGGEEGTSTRCWRSSEFCLSLLTTLMVLLLVVVVVAVAANGSANAWELHDWMLWVKKRVHQHVVEDQVSFLYLMMLLLFLL